MSDGGLIVDAWPEVTSHTSICVEGSDLCLTLSPLTGIIIIVIVAAVAYVYTRD